MRLHQKLRVKSTEKTNFISQIDCSMNYTLPRQHEAILFIVYLTIRYGHKNTAIISDYMKHSALIGYCAMCWSISFSFLMIMSTLISRIMSVYSVYSLQKWFRSRFTLIFYSYRSRKGHCDRIAAVLKSTIQYLILAKNILLVWGISTRSEQNNNCR